MLCVLVLMAVERWPASGVHAGAAASTGRGQDRGLIKYIYTSV